jgi:hypothetical protein
MSAMELLLGDIDACRAHGELGTRTLVCRKLELVAAAYTRPQCKVYSMLRVPSAFRHLKRPSLESRHT